MRILFVGDVVGRAGRRVLFEHMGRLREQYRLDALIVNGENAAGGFGITTAIAKEMLDSGVDLITLGNHAWDQRDLIASIDQEPRIIRPLNMAPGTPGRGSGEFRTERGKRIVVLQVLGRLFMGMYDDPFRALDKAMEKLFLGGNADLILVDIHAEATSEKVALSHYLDGRVSVVVGTHTHIPTADQHILKGGTAYMTDVGMTGDYDSVIGMEVGGSLHRWSTNVPGKRLEAATGEATLCAVFVETVDATGLAKLIEPVRVGGLLAPV